AGAITWNGGCGPLQGSGMNAIAIDGGQILVLPPPITGFLQPNRAVLSWVDNVEDFRTCAVNSDCAGGGACSAGACAIPGVTGSWPRNGELRASGGTPLAGAVRTATTKWYQPILAKRGS